MDEHVGLAASWRFRVVLNGSQYGFSKVVNLAAKMEYDSVAEGGRNDSPLLMRKLPQTHGTLTLERGLRRRGAGDQEGGGAGMKPGTVIREFLLFVDEDKKTKKAARVYSFDLGIVISVDGGELDASDNRVVVERMEIAHTGLNEVKR